MIINLVISIFIFSETYDVYDSISITIPDEFYIYSISSELRYNEANQQYWLESDIDCIYDDIIFTINVSFFGDTSIEQALEKFKFNAIEGKYYNKYSSSLNNEVIENRKKVIKNEFYSFQEFIASWGTGWSSDVIAYSFTPNIESIDRCIISTLNPRYSLGAKQELLIPEINIDAKLSQENEKIQRFYTLYREMIKTVSPNINHEKKIVQGFLYEPERYTEIVIPTIENLRLRDGSSTKSNIVGLVEKRPYNVIQKGKIDNIDGINGRWLRIRPLLQNKLGWAFSGYLREMSEQEIDSFLE